jgi:Cu-Zn family superoxide dismutase
MNQIWNIAICASLAFASVGCTSSAQARPLTAGAIIDGRSGNEARGIAHFTQNANGLRIVVSLVSAPPGRHSVHIDDFADCDAVSTGGHFNPDRSAHGALGAVASHAGDLGDIEVADNGTGELDVVSYRLTLSSGEHSILYRTIVIDERPDDPHAQPWGDSGAPFVCGLIRWHIE